MSSLNNYVREYIIQLRIGNIQKAYKGILTFMTELKAHLEGKYPDYIVSALYLGYMDMTYFAFTPPILKDKKLKIAIVYLHEEYKFELWLAGRNRQIQAEYIDMFSQTNIGRYTLSQIQPGVDSIISSTIMEQPDFENPEELIKQIEVKTIVFVEEILSMLE